MDARAAFTYAFKDTTRLLSALSKEPAIAYLALPSNAYDHVDAISVPYQAQLILNIQASALNNLQKIGGLWRLFEVVAVTSPRIVIRNLRELWAGHAVRECFTMFFPKLLGYVLLAVACTSTASGSPVVRRAPATYSTHAVRDLGDSVVVESFHPPSTYKTFADGAPTDKTMGPNTSIQQAATAFIQSE
ncbi:hypothetical protein EIP91_001827, partial [Steccherinum ochraceum]